MALKPHIIIKNRKGWNRLQLEEVWEYRELLWFNIIKNIKGGFRQTALGPLWMIITPIINMVIYSVIFGGIAKLPSEGVPYPVFTYTALIPWTYFSTAAGGALASMTLNMSVISKVYFPRLIIPLTAVVSGLVNFSISFVILMCMAWYYGYSPSLSILTIPFYLIIAMMTALSVGLWGASLTVRFRDLRNLATYLLRFWMYLTPVVYTATLIPEKWQFIYKINPMYWVIEGFRWALLGKGHPPQIEMVLPVILMVGFLISGAFVFCRTERSIVDLL